MGFFDWFKELFNWFEEQMEKISSAIFDIFSLLNRFSILFGPLLIILVLYISYRQPTVDFDVEALSNAKNVIMSILLISLISGTSSMATVQFWKLIFRPRSTFHYYLLKYKFGRHTKELLQLSAPGFYNDNEFDSKLEDFDPKLKSAKPPEEKSSEKDEKGMDKWSVFLDVPGEILVAKIASTADYLLVNPHEHEDLFRRLVGPSGANDAEIYLSTRRKKRASRDDPLIPLRHLLDQNMDLLLVELQARWKHRVRLASIVIAAAVGLFAASVSNMDFYQIVIVTFTSAIWGGFFSWFVRDIIALAERHRG